MPVHTIPTSMDSMVQPIAIVDALEALVLPGGHRLVGLEEAFRRLLAPAVTRPEDADPMGPLPQDPAWASGDDDRHTLARVVDAVQDVLPNA